MSPTYQEILNFWLGEDLYSETYIHKPQLWFKLNRNTDEQLTELFGGLLSRLESDQEFANDWSADYRGRVALVIVFDQFSRNIYRGSSDMFKNDSKALALALELISNSTQFENLSPIERYFVYMPLIHSEDLDLAKKSVDAVEKLASDAGALQKSHYHKYLQSAKTHYDLLQRFGRYPQRNLLLERESSPDELDFLVKSKHTFVRSVMPLKILDANKSKVPKSTAKATATATKVKTKAPYQRLLFLHGFRQNANKLRHRLSGLLNKLKTECNAQVIFLNGTHPYRPNTGGETVSTTTDEPSRGSQTLMPIESQRTWFNSDDDGRVYSGMDESIAYVLTHINVNGPYGK